MKIDPAEVHTSTILEEINDIFNLQAECKKIQFNMSNKLLHDDILVTDGRRLK